MTYTTALLDYYTHINYLLLLYGAEGLDCMCMCLGPLRRHGPNILSHARSRSLQACCLPCTTVPKPRRVRLNFEFVNRATKIMLCLCLFCDPVTGDGRVGSQNLTHIPTTHNP